MGASGWSYFVPYQADIDAALQALREQVFAQGAYYQPAKFYEMLLESGFSGSVADRLAAVIAERRALPPPRSIAELLERNGLEGTHSIIDIERIAARPAIGAASPLRLDELISLCGTTTPTRAEVMLDKILSGYHSPRGEARYFTVYAGGRPSELFFWGSSGD